MSDQSTSFERNKARENNTVVYLKNPTKEDFTHCFDGFPYTVKAGESLAFPKPIAYHLGKHLAMKIARDKAKKDGLVGDKDKKGQPINIYHIKSLQPIFDSLIVKEIAQELPPELSEGERMRRKTEEFQKNFPATNKEDKPEENITKVKKSDIIKELKDRNIKFNPRSPQETLLKLLMENEAQG